MKTFTRSFFFNFEKHFAIIGLFIFIGVLVEYPVQWIGISLAIFLPIICIPLLTMLFSKLFYKEKF